MKKHTYIGGGVIAGFVALLLLTFTQAPATANHGSVLHNAVDKKDVVNYGSQAVIEGTNPNLHAGQWAYNRVAALQYSPWRYGEIGWWKKSDGSFKGLIVWENPAYNFREFTYSSGVSHSFANQWNPFFAIYDWLYDGNVVWQDTLGFSDADFVFCGGEVATGVEGMGNTRCGDGGTGGLRYLIPPDGQGGWRWVSWNGHVTYVEDPPYQTVNIDSNNFRATGNE